MLAEARRVWRYAVDAPAIVRGLVSWMPGILIGFSGVLFVLIPMQTEWNQGLELESIRLGQLSADWQEYARLRAIDRGFRDSEHAPMVPASTILQPNLMLATSMQSLVNLAEASGLRLEHLRPQAQGGGTERLSHVFAIRLLGRFEALLDFLERLAALGVAVGVVEFVIEASPNVDTITFDALLQVAARESQ
jgi:hypothetical protein